jgi:hypothetical protein
MDIELKEREEQKRKEEEKRARIARKNCKFKTIKNKKI